MDTIAGAGTAGSNGNAGRRSLMLALFAVSYGTNVATPLFLIYEDTLDLSRWTVTALFAIYPIGLAPALAYAGPASDVLGRRPVVLPGLVLSGVASAAMLVGDESLVLLFVGRFLLGAVSGMVLAVASAWMQELGDASPLWNARVLGMVMYGGFGVGPFVGGVLGQWSDRPLIWPYVTHLALVAAGLAVMYRIPETIGRTRRPIRPGLGIPDGGGEQFWRVIVPTALGVFVFPSLAFGLFPVLLRPEMESVALFVTGLVFVLSMTLIVPAQAWVGRVGADRAAPIGLALGSFGTMLGLIAFATGWWGLLFPASTCMGCASGICMTSGLRLVEVLADPTQRGALTGSFYAAAYAGMTAPLVTSTVARVTGFAVALGGVAVVGAALAMWLSAAIRRLAAVGAGAQPARPSGRRLRIDDSM